MSITLVAVRNQRWRTLTTERTDSDGATVNDSNGDPIIDVITDENGNPRKAIQCQCQWSHLGDSSQDWLDFTCTSWDTSPHGSALYTALMNGDHGAIAAE